MPLAAHPPAARPLDAEMNVTPMIDVLLVLLIVFMVATIRAHHTIDLHLPQECALACGTTEEIVLEVLPAGHFRINRSETPATDLFAQLRNIYSVRPDKSIQVAGYPGVRYQDVVAAIDVAKSAGARVVGVPPKSSYLRR